MTFDEIAAALNEKELSFSADEIVMMAVAASTREEYIDCNFLKDVMSGLQKVKKTAMEDFKEVEKEMKKTESAKQADIGKAYLSTLKVGDPIQWMANGEVQEGTVGEPGKGDKTAHLILNYVADPSKKPDRPVKFDKIVVPADFAYEAPTTEDVA